MAGFLKMKVLAAAAASFALIASLVEVEETNAASGSNVMPTMMIENVRAVAPALEKYAQGPVRELWHRPGLAPRDRSIVTLAALIARNQTIEMPHHVALALENGVEPREISEIITHLAFYSGWANAMSAVAAAKEAFAQREIGTDQLPSASPSLLLLDEAVEAERAAYVEKQFGAVSPGVVQYTTELLFRDLWLRPDLAPRDRSLVTVSALIAAGQVAQIPYHLNRAMNNGLTQERGGPDAPGVLRRLAQRFLGSAGCQGGV